MADVLLVNKTDLVPNPKDLETEIRDINGSAPIFQTQHGIIPLDRILDLHAYDGLQSKEDAPQKFTLDLIHNQTSGKNKSSLSNVGTVTLSYSDAVDKDKLEMYLQDLLWEDKYEDSDGNKVKILRLKGLVALDGEGELGQNNVIIQGVQDTYDMYDTKAECQGCTLVLIGKYLDFDILNKGLRDTLLSQ